MTEKIYILDHLNCNFLTFKVELTGSSFFDYIHQADHQELADQLGVNLDNPGSNSPGPGEEGGPAGAAPPIPDGKPCKW